MSTAGYPQCKTGATMQVKDLIQEYISSKKPKKSRVSLYRLGQHIAVDLLFPLNETDVIDEILEIIKKKADKVSIKRYYKRKKNQNLPL